MNNVHPSKPFFDNKFVRFIFSAGSGFLVDVLSFYIFYHNLFVQKDYTIFSATISNYTLSFTISFFLGVLVNFIITRYLVFSESTLPPAKQFLRFFSVAFIGYFANLGVLHVFIKYLHLYPPVARPLAALSLFFASYFVHKLFSFNLSLRHHARTNHPSGN
ncbi:GtrA family protein [Mucilaginibacter robiniae]|uniref:GtrA family protein n=1 Tax=Mucilaginibacter robiniae TaxID=2728022 RepID=A0A7L5E5H8_9SPHI|nr:GtrA family protein [Mucilaginibacter robiniae]QJD97878.1 GtrA family protein [Mucilaginibacter robiniae]